MTSESHARREEAARIGEALDHAEMRQRTRQDAQRATLANKRKPPVKVIEYRRGTGTTGRE